LVGGARYKMRTLSLTNLLSKTTGLSIFCFCKVKLNKNGNSRAQDKSRVGGDRMDAVISAQQSWSKMRFNNSEKATRV
jgi:hypothetical protein